MSVPERELVAQAQSGSLEAFDELVSAYQARVYALARRMLGSEDDAADVQQESFVLAWRSLRGFKGNSEFGTWLYRITVNLCISWKRRRIEEAVEPSFFEEKAGSVGPSAAACLEKAETVVTVRRVLASMPGHHRALIVLREMEGRPFEEIAGILGCSVASARTRACRARAMLRERMRPYLE